MSRSPDPAPSEAGPSDAAAREAFAYAQAPRPVGFPVAFRLRGKALEVERMGRVDRLPLERVSEVRLSYEARSLAPGALRTKLRLDDGRTVVFTSISFRSMFDARRQDAEYGRFLRELLRRVAKAAPQARFAAGRPFPVWALIATFAVAIVVALAYFAWQVWLVGETAIAVAAAVIGLVGVWQLEPLVRHNKPRAFAPDDPPETLAPRG